MPDVSGRYFAELLDALERRDFDIAELLDGLPVRRNDLYNGGKLEWDVFVELMERVETRAGGPAGVEKIGEELEIFSVTPLLRRLAGYVALPYAFYTSGNRWVSRRAAPAIESRIERIDRHSFRVSCRISESRAACSPIFHLATGVLRSSMKSIRVLDPVVESAISGRRAEWVVSRPSSRPLWLRSRILLRTLLSSRDQIDASEARRRELRDGFRLVSAAYKDVEASEARYRALAEASVDLTVEIEPDLRLRYISPSATELLGRDADESLGTDLLEWLHPEDRANVAEFVASAFQDAARSRVAGTMARPTFRIEHCDGRWIWMEMDARIYQTRTGADRAVATLRDVSDRMKVAKSEKAVRDALETEVAARTQELQRKNRDLREIQSLLLDAERLGVSRDLAGRIAHSINNPLTALMGQITLLIDDTEPSDPRLFELLELAGRVGDVVERTLALYREGKINCQQEDIGRVMRDLYLGVSHSANKVGIRTRLEVASGMPDVSIDRPLLLAALESVAENALDFVDPHGEIVLHAEIAEVDSEPVLRICISDTGPGVPTPIREDIFRPFFTTKTRGTGLGLAIARGIIHGHHGDLRVGDHVGGGAEFVADIPLQPTL